VHINPFYTSRHFFHAKPNMLWSYNPYLLPDVSFAYHVLLGKEINRIHFHRQHLQETDLCALKQRYLIGKGQIYIKDDYFLVSMLLP